jgi:hypothetical protein
MSRSIHHSRRVSSMTVLLAMTTGFVGGRGWMAGRSAGHTVAVPATVEAHAGHHSETGNSTPPPAATVADAHPGHVPDAPDAARGDDGADRKHHGHDCDKGVCRCDSRCPSRRSGPCGSALSPCHGGEDEAGANPGPVRPFLLPPAVLLQPVFERHGRPDVAFLPATRALEPSSPPPRTSSV